MYLGKVTLATPLQGYSTEAEIHSCHRKGEYILCADNNTVTMAQCNNHGTCIILRPLDSKVARVIDLHLEKLNIKKRIAEIDNTISALSDGMSKMHKEEIEKELEVRTKKLT